jgi:hypothetical protein
MINQIEFLRQRAAELRHLASRAPEIAASLDRLADELEAEAANLEEDHHGSSDADRLA